MKRWKRWKEKYRIAKLDGTLTRGKVLKSSDVMAARRLIKQADSKYSADELYASDAQKNRCP